MVMGSRGADGKAGAQGPTGAAGAQGPTGAAGPAGPAGAQGPTGAAGAQGPTGAAGADGKPGAQGADGKPGAQGADGKPGAQGAAGPNGLAGTVFMSSATVGQIASTAIALGIRELTVACVGIVKGDKLLPFCTSYKINGGASILGRPPGYAIVDCACNADGQVTISLNAPLLAIGNSYEITCAIHKVSG